MYSNIICSVTFRLIILIVNYKIICNTQELTCTQIYIPIHVNKNRHRTERMKCYDDRCCEEMWFCRKEDGCEINAALKLINTGFDTSSVGVLGHFSTCFFFRGSTAPGGTWSSDRRSFTNTPRHTALDRVLLYKWSARRRDLCLTVFTRDRHLPDGVRIHIPSKRTAADPRLTPHAHWNRLPGVILDTFRWY